MHSRPGGGILCLDAEQHLQAGSVAEARKGKGQVENIYCTEIGDKPAARWWNLNIGWSYPPWHECFKSAEGILATYRAVRSKGAVSLLNVGPRLFGELYHEEKQVLRELGQTIRRYHL